MSASLYLNFLENVYNRNLDFCVICLRSSEERRLMTPKYVLRFNNSINVPLAIDDQHQRACYICERQAAAAFQYRLAANRATFALSTIKGIAKNGARQNMIRTGIALGSNAIWLAAVLDCESKFAEARSRPKLLITDVLVTDSQSPSQDAPNLINVIEPDIKEDPLEPGQSEDQYIVPDDIPRTQSVTYEDKLWIKSESTDKTSMAHSPEKNTIPKNIKLAPIQKLLDHPENGAMARLDENTISETHSTESANAYVLHPIVMKDGVQTVPSLSYKRVNNQFVKFYNIADNTVKMVIESPQSTFRVYSHCPKNQNRPPKMLPKILPDRSLEKLPTTNNLPVIVVGDLTGNSVQNSAQSSNPAQTVISSQSGNSAYIQQGNPAQISNYGLDAGSFNSGPDLNSSLNANYNSAQDLNSGHNSESNNSAQHLINILNTPFSYPAVSKDAETTAVMRSDRIDWEDKIPMDMISFVDECEKAAKIARYSEDPPPLGICNVMSLSDDVIDIS